MGLMRVYRTGHSKRVPRTLNGRVTRGSATPPRGPPGTPARAASEIRSPGPTQRGGGTESVKRVKTPAQGEREAPNAYPWGKGEQRHHRRSRRRTGRSNPTVEGERELLHAREYSQKRPPGNNGAHDGTPQARHPLPVDSNCHRRAHRPLRPPPLPVAPTATPTVVPTAPALGAPWCRARSQLPVAKDHRERN